MNVQTQGSGLYLWVILMYSKKKILALTATRSDYDLLSYVYKLLDNDKSLDFKLLVSGTHLSNTYGSSVNEIEKDGLTILTKIESLLDSDSRAARVKSAAILMQDCLHSILDFAPDIILYCGDREDAMVGAMVSTYLQIPGIHVFGGDHASDGHIDNPVRHAISKLSTAHFVSIEEHKQRLLKIGEPQYRIFQVGSPAIDKLIKEVNLSKLELAKIFNLTEWPEKCALLTYHPMTHEEDKAGVVVDNILKNLLDNNYFIFCNSPNSDAGSKKIIEAFAKYNDHPHIYFFKNLSRTLFVNLLRHCELMIGNSSAGIIEAATCNTKVINVGKRQFGRFNAGNVIFCENTYESINEAILKSNTEEYNTLVSNLINPYGDGYSSERIYEILINSNFKEIIAKKEDPLCF